MTIHKYTLLRRAQGTSSKFHIEGKEIACVVEIRAGLGECYIYQTDDATEARRLQIVHGFKIEHRGILPSIDKAQIKKLGETKPIAKTEKTKVTRRRGRKKKEE